jgi:hypothetical protein
MDIVDYSQIKGWTVTAQAADQVIVTDAGRPVTGVQVFFATENGNAGSVFVPDEHYHRDKIHKAIGHRAHLMDEVGRLTRDSLR